MWKYNFTGQLVTLWVYGYTDYIRYGTSKNTKLTLEIDYAPFPYTLHQNIHCYLFQSSITDHDLDLSLTSQICKSPIFYHWLIYQCLLNVPFSRMILYWVENRSAPSSFIPLLSWFLNSVRQTMLLLNVFCNLDWLLKDTVFRQRNYELFWDGISYYSERPKKQQWKWMNKSILY